MFLHVWEHLDQAMEETQEEIVNIYWAQIFTCGVDGNKYGDAGCGFGNCVGYMCVQER